MEKNDIVYIEMDIYIEETNKLVETCDEKKAKDSGIYNEKNKYKPFPIVVGSDELNKLLDESIMKAEKDKEYEVLTGKNTFGEYEHALIKIYSQHEFRRKKVEPEINKIVEIDNKIGRIISITPGRIRVDFNHPYAGKTVKYKYKIVQIVEKLEEKVLAAIEKEYGDQSNFIINVEKINSDNFVNITLPDICKYDILWQKSKYKIVTILRENLGFKKIKFIEEYIKKEKELEEQKSENENEQKK